MPAHTGRPRGEASEPSIVVQVDDGVGVLRLNRPEVLNAYDEEMNEALIEAVAALEADPDVVSILVHGVGRSFCAGADIRVTRHLTGAAARRHVLLDLRAKQALAECAKPVVAAVHGYAVGGGFELAMACDVRFASDDAIFSLREIQLGTIPGSGGLQRLAITVGRAIAMDWALSGRNITADEAARAGAVKEVVRDSAVAPAALRYCRDLAKLNPLALSLIKRAIAPRSDVSLETTAYHALASQALHAEQAFKKGTARFDV